MVENVESTEKYNEKNKQSKSIVSPAVRQSLLVFWLIYFRHNYTFYKTGVLHYKRFDS